MLARHSTDWQARYGHPVLGVETCVGPAHFAGTLYTASGWTELGQTDGTGFTAQMAADHGRRVMLAVTARHPDLHSPS